MAVLNEEERVRAEEKARAEDYNSRIGENYRKLMYGDPAEVTRSVKGNDYAASLRERSKVIPKNKPHIYFDEENGNAIIKDSAADSTRIRPIISNRSEKGYFSANPFNPSTNHIPSPTAIKTRTEENVSYEKNGVDERMSGSSIRPTLSRPRTYAAETTMSEFEEREYISEKVRPYSARNEVSSRIRENTAASEEDSIPNSAIRRRISPELRELESIRPGEQTMLHLNNYEEKKPKAKEDSDLSLQTKVILAIFAAVIIIAFTVIFVNSALLNSLNEEADEYYASMQEYATEAEGLSKEIEEATSEETIFNYASDKGMIIVK